MYTINVAPAAGANAATLVAISALALKGSRRGLAHNGSPVIADLASSNGLITCGTRRANLIATCPILTGERPGRRHADRSWAWTSRKTACYYGVPARAAST
jgi:hypothetical protein